MANPHRGEVALVAGDKTYTLALTINAVCELEDLLQKSVSEIEQDRGSIRTLRAMLWAALREHHPMDLEDAGRLMQEAGASAAGEAVRKAVSLAFPAPDSKADRKNPR